MRHVAAGPRSHAACCPWYETDTSAAACSSPATARSANGALCSATPWSPPDASPLSGGAPFDALW